MFARNSLVIFDYHLYVLIKNSPFNAQPLRHWSTDMTLVLRVHQKYLKNMLYITLK